jgi:hypothetical protein
MTKVTLATLVCFYPAALINLSLFVGIAVASLLSFKTSIPISSLL